MVLISSGIYSHTNRNPKFDPHGDPIPDKFGKFPTSNSIPLSNLKEGDEGIVMGVSQDNSTFLKFLDRINS